MKKIRRRGKSQPSQVWVPISTKEACQTKLDVKQIEFVLLLKWVNESNYDARLVVLPSGSTKTSRSFCEAMMMEIVGQVFSYNDACGDHDLLAFRIPTTDRYRILFLLSKNKYNAKLKTLFPRKVTLEPSFLLALQASLGKRKQCVLTVAGATTTLLAGTALAAAFLLRPTDKKWKEIALAMENSEKVPAALQLLFSIPWSSSPPRSLGIGASVPEVLKRILLRYKDDCEVIEIEEKVYANRQKELVAMFWSSDAKIREAMLCWFGDILPHAWIEVPRQDFCCVGDVSDNPGFFLLLGYGIVRLDPPLEEGHSLCWNFVRAMLGKHYETEAKPGQDFMSLIYDQVKDKIRIWRRNDVAALVFDMRDYWERLPFHRYLMPEGMDDEFEKSYPATDAAFNSFVTFLQAKILQPKEEEKETKHLRRLPTLDVSQTFRTKLEFRDLASTPSIVRWIKPHNIHYIFQPGIPFSMGMDLWLLLGPQTMAWTAFVSIDPRSEQLPDKPDPIWRRLRDHRQKMQENQANIAKTFELWPFFLAVPHSNYLSNDPKNQNQTILVGEFATKLLAFVLPDVLDHETQVQGALSKFLLQRDPEGDTVSWKEFLDVEVSAQDLERFQTFAHAQLDILWVPRPWTRDVRDVRTYDNSDPAVTFQILIVCLLSFLMFPGRTVVPDIILLKEAEPLCLSFDEKSYIEVETKQFVRVVTWNEERVSQEQPTGIYFWNILQKFSQNQPQLHNVHFRHWEENRPIYSFSFAEMRKAIQEVAESGVLTVRPGQQKPPGHVTVLSEAMFQGPFDFATFHQHAKEAFQRFHEANA